MIGCPEEQQSRSLRLVSDHGKSRALCADLDTHSLRIEIDDSGYSNPRTASKASCIPVRVEQAFQACGKAAEKTGFSRYGKTLGMHQLQSSNSDSDTAIQGSL
jgi:hypothetical protein